MHLQHNTALRGFQLQSCFFKLVFRSSGPTRNGTTKQYALEKTVFRVINVKVLQLKTTIILVAVSGLFLPYYCLYSSIIYYLKLVMYLYCSTGCHGVLGWDRRCTTQALERGCAPSAQAFRHTYKQDPQDNSRSLINYSVWLINFTLVFNELYSKVS